LVGGPVNWDRTYLGGAAYLFFGPVTGELYSSESERRIYGEAEGDAFGHRAAAGPDVGGDGAPDLLVSAYGSDEAGDDAGKIYLFNGE